MTIKEIAREAGVAMSTVSLVLNNKPGVRKETRAHVAEFLIANGYTIRDSSSENTAHGEIRFLRLIASNHINERNHEFFTDLLNGAERQARQQGFDFSFANVPASEFASALHALGTRENLDNPIEYCPLNSINTDNISGSFSAIQELYRQGHREIGFLRGEVEIGGMHERYEGYCKAMQSFGLSVNPDYVIRVDTIVDVAAKQMSTRLGRLDPMPTAFFACNDFIAAGAVRALLQAGYRIPEDISIIGFDDVQICSFVSPPLSTIRIDRFRMGELGVERLLALRQGDSDRLRCLMGVTPVLRTSIAPPRTEK